MQFQRKKLTLGDICLSLNAGTKDETGTDEVADGVVGSSLTMVALSTGLKYDRKAQPGSNTKKLFIVIFKFLIMFNVFAVRKNRAF